jgi:signal transduction histidine kinase
MQLVPDITGDTTLVDAPYSYPVDILLVDDREQNLLALEAALNPLGHNCVKAKSGQEALRLLLKRDFALILMDVQMPSMDGFETAKLIRQRGRNKYTPIIFLTAFNRDQGYEVLGYESGAIDYMFKPVEPQILRSKVTAFVELFQKREEVKRHAQALLKANQQLKQAVDQRRQAEESLEILNAELERRVEERTAQLAASNAELQQFANIASHDLQEPLRQVQGYAELLLRRYKGKLDEDGDEFLHFILDGVDRMQELIQDVLKHSVLDSDSSSLSWVNFAQLLDQVLLDLEQQIKESKAEVVFSDLPTVFVDAVQIRQLLQNLIGNALKFRSERAPKIEIDVKEQGDEWLFSVSDNGIGFEMEYKDRVFEMFRRLHTRDKHAGTGIGLTICKKIIDWHRGRIWVESEVGKGTTFFFTLPASAPLTLVRSDADG